MDLAVQCSEVPNRWRRRQTLLEKVEYHDSLTLFLGRRRHPSPWRLFLLEFQLRLVRFGRGSGYRWGTVFTGRASVHHGSLEIHQVLGLPIAALHGRIERRSGFGVTGGRLMGVNALKHRWRLCQSDDRVLQSSSSGILEKRPQIAEGLRFSMLRASVLVSGLILFA